MAKRKKKYFLLVKEVSIRYEQVVTAYSDDDADEMFDDKLLKEVGVAKNYLDPIPCDEDGNPLEEGQGEVEVEDDNEGDDEGEDEGDDDEDEDEDEDEGDDDDEDEDDDEDNDEDEDEDEGDDDDEDEDEDE